MSSGTKIFTYRHDAGMTGGFLQKVKTYHKMLQYHADTLSLESFVLRALPNGKFCNDGYLVIFDHDLFHAKLSFNDLRPSIIEVLSSLRIVLIESCDEFVEFLNTVNHPCTLVIYGLLSFVLGMDLFVIRGQKYHLCSSAYGINKLLHEMFLIHVKYKVDISLNDPFVNNLALPDISLPCFYSPDFSHEQALSCDLSQVSVYTHNHFRSASSFTPQPPGVSLQKILSKWANFQK